MVGSNLGLTQQAMFPDYYPFIQLGQVKRDVVNTGFPKESNGDTGCKESHFYSLPFGQAEANIY